MGDDDDDDDHSMFPLFPLLPVFDKEIYMTDYEDGPHAVRNQIIMYTRWFIDQAKMQENQPSIFSFPCALFNVLESQYYQLKTGNLAMKSFSTLFLRCALKNNNLLFLLSSYNLNHNLHPIVILFLLFRTIQPSLTFSRRSGTGD